MELSSTIVDFSDTEFCSDCQAVCDRMHQIQYEEITVLMCSMCMENHRFALVRNESGCGILDVNIRPRFRSAKVLIEQDVIQQAALFLGGDWMTNQNIMVLPAGECAWVSLCDWLKLIRFKK